MQTQLRFCETAGVGGSLCTPKLLSAPNTTLRRCLMRGQRSYPDVTTGHSASPSAKTNKSARKLPGSSSPPTRHLPRSTNARPQTPTPARLTLLRARGAGVLRPVAAEDQQQLVACEAQEGPQQPPPPKKIGAGGWLGLLA